MPQVPTGTSRRGTGGADGAALARRAGAKLGRAGVSPRGTPFFSGNCGNQPRTSWLLLCSHHHLEGVRAMTTEQAHPVLRYLRKLAASPGLDVLTDGQLLERFVAAQDEAAFAALVRRH